MVATVRVTIAQFAAFVSRSCVYIRCVRMNESACFCRQVGVMDKDCVCGVNVYQYLLRLIPRVG